MQIIQEVFSKVETVLSGKILVFFLLFSGIYLTVKFRFFQLRGFRFILKNTVGTLLQKEKRQSDANISPFQAVTTALAGTMGVGNIAGVSTALVAGGPGAIFWMWIGAFFGMITKYSEIFLAVKYRQKNTSGRYYGGPMYYIQRLPGGRQLAGIFAILCACCSLGIGNMTQINSISTAMQDAYQVPYWVSGLAVAVVVMLVIFGGIQRIARVTEAVIPLISLVYIGCAGAFLFIHRSAVPTALAQIVTEAFRIRPAVSGLAGYGVSRALSVGLSRGTFTNEAGLGSAPIAHASAACKSPAHQGAWGIFEVFLDTIVVCTITALVVLLADGGTLWQSGLNGAPLTSAAFAYTFGRFGNQFISVSIVFFAIAAMLGWCFYGESALRYLSGDRKSPLLVYRILFLVCILIGAVTELTVVWRLSDFLNALMAVPNILALFLLRKEIQVPTASTCTRTPHPSRHRQLPQ